MPPPPYHVGQPSSTSSDVKEDEAGYPQQVAGYLTGTGPIQSLPQQQGYPAQVAYNYQWGYTLQPAVYSHVSKIIILS